MVTNREWIIATLRTLNNRDPVAIGLSENHFEILEQQLMINPNEEWTPFQNVLSKYQKDQQQIQE
jgi:hypothetical protein